MPIASQPPGPQVLRQAIEQGHPLILGEIDRHVAAENDRKIVGDGPDRVAQVEMAELHQIANLGHDAKGAGAGAASEQEKPPEPCRGNALHVARGVDRAGGELEHLQRKVAGPDLRLLSRERH